MTSLTNWESELDRIFEFIYPERWDKKRGMFHLNYYVYFPEITVTNEENMSHKIYELYVKFKFYNNRRRLNHIQAVRARVSPSEYFSGYGHSHLLSDAANGNFTTFCFGTTPIASDYSDFQIREFDSMRIEAFLYAFDEYLKWESLEGGPYVKIKDIRNSSEVPLVENSVKEDHYNRFINKYEFQDFIINSTYFQINEEDADFIKKVTDITGEKYLVFKRSNTNEYYIQHDQVMNLPSPFEIFSFKREMVKFIVDPLLEKEEENNDKELYANPNITRYIAEKLSRELTLFAYYESGRVTGESEDISLFGVTVQDLQTASHTG